MFKNANAHIEGGPRQYQQDRAYVSDDLLIVCDGMGGHVNGEVASHTAISVVSELHGQGLITDEDSLVSAVIKARDAVYDLGMHKMDAHYDPGTTIVTALAIPDSDEVIICWAGDSVAYIHNEDSPGRITTDHSDSRGVITKCLGGGDLGNPPEGVKPYMAKREDYVWAPETVTIKVASGDIIYLTSDGVPNAYYRNFADETGFLGLTTTQEVIDDVAKQGFVDNTTVVIATIR